MNLLLVALVLLSGIFVVGAFSPLVFVDEPIEPVLFFQASRNIEEYDSNTDTFTNWSGYKITHNDNGDVKIVNQEGESGRVLFAITGTSTSGSLTRTSRDFNWNWVLEEEKLVLFDRNSFRYFLKGTNDSSALPIEQVWRFYENDDPKLTYKITNNFEQITNAKFWFIYVLNKNDLVEFDGVQRLLSDDSFVRLTSVDGINAKEKLLKINNATGFDFQDLNQSGFEFTDLVLGSGDLIGKPNLVIVGIGVTKNNGVFPVGSSVELDPTILDTGAIFPNKAYNAQSDWSSINNLLDNIAVPNRFAVVTLNLKSVDLNQFGKFNSADGNNLLIPFGAEIRGIEIIVRAKMIDGLCGAPAETGELGVFMLVDGAVHSNTKFKTWSCTEGETTKIFGSPTDLWTFDEVGDWNNLHFDYNHFAIRLRTFNFTNGGQWGPAPNAGVNFLQVKVYYSRNCFFSLPFPPPFGFSFDCNCFDGISAQPGNINLGGRDFNIFGEGTFEIRTDIRNIGVINVDSSCRVDKFDGFTLRG